MGKPKTLTEHQPLETSLANYHIDHLPEVQRTKERLGSYQALGVEEPYFRLADDRKTIDFNSYNYLGLKGHPEVNQAAIDAIEKFGTSVSASRLVGGEISLHRQLEDELADFLGVEAALVLVSGHATNVSLISHLLGPKDLIVYDDVAHNSAVTGAVASGAKRIRFAHNDMDSLEKVLARERSKYRRTMVWVEGLYSMDGDSPDLARLRELQDKYHVLLMVDEAHSIGVLGETGRGLAEFQSVARSNNVIWMGTFSKSFASCGGFLAGSSKFIEYLKYTLSGFVYSVGMTPANAAASMAALRVLRREPERVKQLHDRSRFLKESLENAGFSTGDSLPKAIIPVYLKDAETVVRVGEKLYQAGLEASGIVHPAVPKDKCRLRFFVSSNHTEEDITKAVEILKSACGNSVSQDRNAALT